MLPLPCYDAFWLYTSSLRLWHGTGWIPMIKKPAFWGCPRKRCGGARSNPYTFCPDPTHLWLVPASLRTSEGCAGSLLLCWDRRRLSTLAPLSGLLPLRPPLRIWPAEEGDPQSMHFTQARGVSAQTAAKEKKKNHEGNWFLLAKGDQKKKKLGLPSGVFPF